MNNTSLGMAAAATAAGPLFMLFLAVASSVQNPTTTASNLGFTLVFAPIAMLVGLILALPASLAGLPLAWLGARFGAARHPAVWAVVGAAVGSCIPHFPDDGASPASLLTACVGMACALICRSIVRWGS